ncbi:MAG: acetyl-CoA carboxylase biotin carboxyl carrier protein [Terriglobia bacterium]
MKKKTQKSARPAAKKSQARPSNPLPLEQVHELIDLLEQRGLEEFEFERAGVRIRIKRRGHTPAPPPAHVVEAFPPAADTNATESAPSPAPPVSAEEVAEGKSHVVKSPIVGTFYAAPASDAPPFVKLGDTVEVGQVLCIIEAMKLMNEIEADAAGEIVRIYLENGQPVEYGESLFAIRPARKQ